MIEAKQYAGGASLTYLMIGGGPGAFIGAVHKAACDLSARARLVGGCFSRTFENSVEQGRMWGLDPGRVYGTYEEMLRAEAARSDKPDFVVIVTPNDTHFPIAKLALLNGFHVSCDKPLCLSSAEADELVRLAREKNREFLVTYGYLGYPLIRQAREMIRRGDLGDIRLIGVEYLQDWLSDEVTGNKQAAWRTDPRQSGAAGCMGDIGTHAESLARFVTGQEMSGLTARLETFVPGRALDDNGFVLFKTRGGASGSLWASQVAVGRENGLSLRVYGSSGSLEWEQENPNRLLFAVKGGPARILTRGQAGLHPHAIRHTRLPAGHPEGLFEAFAALYDGFIASILARREGRTPDALDWYPSVLDGALGVRFIEAATTSSVRGGSWVDLPGTFA